jgi:DNA-binding SARP family transcriptional activator
MARPTLTVRLLGGFSVAIGERVVPDSHWVRRSAADLVKLLALAPRHRLAREQVAEALWPSLDGEAASVNTRRAAHFARRDMGVAGSVVLSEGRVELAPDFVVATDVLAFEKAAAQVAQSGDPVSSGRAADLYPGDLLPDDRYEEWCAAERDRLRRLYLDALAGAERWEDLATVEPTHEPAHRELMRSRLRAGDRGGALRAFEDLRRSLRELGLTPDDASVELYEQALEPTGAEHPTPRERARSLLAWGVVHWERTDLGEAQRAADEVKALAIDAGLGCEYVEA